MMSMIVVSQLFAQSQRVSGKITDEAGQAVPGASILEKGTTNGSVSDANGDYALNVAGPNAVLVISFIGYKSQEINVGGRTTIDVKMDQDVTALQEVIVTGYTSERKQDLVSAVSQISAANTVAIPVSNVEQAMQGRVAGVIVQTSGQPGAPSQVRIRGFGSFGGNAPLYIVDGVPTFDVSNVNPYDIESTTVLKDAGAASIYGARAAAGVIIYTTKHGKNDGKTRVDFDMSTGLNFPGDGISMLKGGKITPTLVEPWYHPSIFVYDRSRQEWIVFDHNLKNPQVNPVDPSVAIAPYLVCPTNDNKLLVFDKADNSVKKVNRFTNESLFEFTIDTTKLAKAPDFIFLREYQNMIFLLDKNSGIWVYNNIGKLVNSIQVAGLEGFGFYGEEIFFLRDGVLTLFDLYTEKTRQIPLEKAYRQSYITDERVISIDNYSRVSLCQFIDTPKG